MASLTKPKLPVTSSAPRKHFTVCSDHNRVCRTTRDSDCSSSDQSGNPCWHRDSLVQHWMPKPHPALILRVVTPHPRFALGGHGYSVCKSTRYINYLWCVTGTVCDGKDNAKACCVPDVLASHPRTLGTRECPFPRDQDSQVRLLPMQTALQNRTYLATVVLGAVSTPFPFPPRIPQETASASVGSRSMHPVAPDRKDPMPLRFQTDRPNPLFNQPRMQTEEHQSNDAPCPALPRID